jgi:exonuclease SbcD
MKILHTSDWHIGRSLYGTRRYEEFTKYLNWLNETIEKENISILLIAGDIFDTSAPGSRAQELYYKFLCKLTTSKCRHIIITAGNHDSPSFLEAPKELLKVINVRVSAAITDNISDEVLTLKDTAGNPEIIVCAVPYLRDKDIRTAESGESISDKNKKINEGIKNHYNKVFKYAEKVQSEIFKTHKNYLPIIAMGHLFAAGGKTTDGDGVRELYIGTLAHIDKSIFPESISYTALGHLHVPQVVASTPPIRYSGSPLPIGFGESEQKKLVIIVEFNTKDSNVKTPQATIKEIEVPRFQALKLIKGDFDKISKELDILKQKAISTWVEIQYTGKEIIGNLKEQIEIKTENSPIEVLRIQNKQIMDRTLTQTVPEESLEKLSEVDVFKRCLEAAEIPKEQYVILEELYAHTLKLITETDNSNK